MWERMKIYKKKYVKTESEVRERWRETERRRSKMVLSEMFFILLSKTNFYHIFPSFSSQFSI